MSAYVTIAELARFGWHPETFIEVDAVTKADKISARSDYIDGFLASHFTLPLVEWGDDIRRCCAVLTSIDLIMSLGTGPGDRELMDAEEDRQNAWLRLIASGQITPRVRDSTPSATVGGSNRPARVVSASSRGFSTRGTGLSRGPFQSD